MINRGNQNSVAPVSHSIIITYGLGHQGFKLRSFDCFDVQEGLGQVF
jgi:hypothetical protein